MPDDTTGTAKGAVADGEGGGAVPEGEELDIEKGLAALEKIADELEAGELPLPKAIKRFEEGMQLAQRLEKWLDAAEAIEYGCVDEVLKRMPANEDGKKESQP